MEIGGHGGTIDRVALLVVLGVVVFLGVYGVMYLGQVVAYILHNIQLAAFGPFAIGVFSRHHPDGGPGTPAIGQLGTHLYPTIFPLGNPLGSDAGRGNGGHAVATRRIDRFRPSLAEATVCDEGTVVTADDVQIAVLLVTVFGAGHRVILQLAVAHIALLVGPPGGIGKSVPIEIILKYQLVCRTACGHQAKRQTG